MPHSINKNHKFVLLSLIAIGVFFRFYNLNWGVPFYFHPDERNIASSVSQLQFPDQMNPHFFAYGSLPIYTIYFTGLLTNIFSNCVLETANCLPLEVPRSGTEWGSVSLEQAIVISRIFSAVFSLALIPLLFSIGKRLGNTIIGLASATLATLSVGLIQFAHFGTFEMWLAFFSLLLFFLCLKINENAKIKLVVYAGVIIGALVSIKVSSLTLVPLPFIALLFPNKQLRKFVFLVAIGAATYFLISPFVLLDLPAFQHSMNYESSVALGTLPVFYTDGFYNTTPILYQFIHVYSFLINPLLTILFVPAFMYLLIITYGALRLKPWCLKLPPFALLCRASEGLSAYFFKRATSTVADYRIHPRLKSWFSAKADKTKRHSYLLLVTCYVLLFFSQAFLFVKWTRYIVPTLPFVYLILALSITDILQLVTKKHQISSLKYIVFSFLITISTIFALAYVITAFVQTDTRIAASLWAKQHIPSQAKILSESYDLGIVPFNADFPNISLFNFYDLDSPGLEGTYRQLTEALRTNEYIILPSQRIYQMRLSNAGKFPSGNRFYTMILSNQLGFTKIYETPCDMFCRITYMDNPIFSYEQTANVFDRPIVMIFRKNENFK